MIYLNKPAAIHSWCNKIMVESSRPVPNEATEYCFMDHPINKNYLKIKIKITNGCTPKPNGHGLGVLFKDVLSKKFQYKEKINTMISTDNDEIKLK